MKIPTRVDALATMASFPRPTPESFSIGACRRSLAEIDPTSLPLGK
jgi:hypothetical protein